MSQLAMFAVDWLAVGLLALALYFPRHRRRDLVVSFLCVNVGVLAVSSVLSSAAIAAGVGLGLFGVLSIIRLRSIELEQHEVAHTSRRWRSGCWPVWPHPARSASG